jgi:Family of unknown function (DUF6941)
MTGDVARDLDVARGMAAAGVPIFVAYPDPAQPAGYRLPGRWQATSANPAYADAWKPGRALCAVMGQGLDLIDIDPRNGGDLAGLDELLPEVYAAAATPSGGMHLFVKSLGVRSLDDVLPGIDVKAGDPEGNGRGFAFIAPTVRVSKTTGERVAYCWTSPDIDLLERLKNAAGDTSGAPLAELIRGKHGKHGSGTGSGWTDPDIDALIEHGITEGGQDVQLRDTVWKLRGRNLSKPVVRSAWRSIVAKTPLKDPPRPWTEADFERHWQGADRKQESAVPGTSPRTGRHRARSGEQSDPRPAEPLSELGYARRLIAVYGDRIRYVPAWRRWLLHMIAAGVDTIYTSAVPAIHQAGIGIRLTMTPAEARHQHQIEVVFQNEDGVRIAQITGAFAPQDAVVTALPPGVRPSIAIPFNMNMPIPAYGRYSLELLVDGNSLKSIDITVTRPPAGDPPVIPGHA